MIYKPHCCNGACNGAFISLLLTPLRRWEWYITCTKCFAFHVSKFEILKTTWKNKTKSIKMLDVLMKNWKIRVWCSLFHFFHVTCKISNFNMWTAKHLAQASCTELTLPWGMVLIKNILSFNNMKISSETKRLFFHLASVKCSLIKSSCFLRRPQKITKSSPLIWYFLSERQIKGKDFVIFYRFLRKHEL